MLDTTVVTTVVTGALTACSAMFIAGVAAITKLYGDMKQVIATQESDMKSVQAKLDDCHNERKAVLDELVKLGISLPSRNKSSRNLP